MKTNFEGFRELFVRYFNKTSHFLRKNLWLSLVLSLPFVVLFWVFIFYQTVARGFWCELPTSQELNKIENPIASEVYGSDGVLLGKYFIEDRKNISFDALSPNLVQALLATEDIRFYEHSGIDYYSLLRVIVKSLFLQQSHAGGGSTLSQQLVKNLFPRIELGLFSLPVNKAREMVIAQRLEDLMKKEEILSFYLNTVSFGENAFGIEAAAQRFFNQPARTLKVEQAAMLVAMLKAPTTYNPRKNPERARQRRNLVIGQMEAYGYLGMKAADSIRQMPLELDFQYVSHNSGPAPYFREKLRTELTNWCKTQRKADGSFYNLYTDGLKIYTSINSKLQAYAVNALKTHLNKIQKKFDKDWSYSSRSKAMKDWLEYRKTASRRYKNAERKQLSDEQIQAEMEQAVSMRIFSWEGPKDTILTPLDSLMFYEFLLRGSFLAMNPKNGQLLAWVGGPDHQFFQFDHVTSHRQAGSIFKPIVFATALEEGYSPCTYFENEQNSYARYDDWKPKNSDEDYGGEYSMQGALTHSVNVVAVNAIMDIGPQKVRKLANRMGIQSVQAAYPSLALGATDVSLLEMVQAYSVFVNQGMYKSPVYLLRIENQSGKTLFEIPSDHEGVQVLSSKSAEMMRQMLKGVTDHGTGRALHTRYKLGKEIMGKTGTSQNQADGWYVGATPDLVAGAWVGGDDRRVHFKQLRDGQGAATALPIFAQFLQKVFNDPDFEGLSKNAFPKPSVEVREALDCDEFAFPMGMAAFRAWWEMQRAKEVADSIARLQP